MPENGQSHPHASRVRLAVYRVKPAASVIVRWLSDDYGGLFVHWHASRSVYCDPEGCPPQIHKQPRSYRGYCSSELWDSTRQLWIPVVFEITESLDQDLSQHKLRGQIWRISKGPKTASGKSPVTGEILEDIDPRSLPEPFTVVDVLNNLYHCELVDLGAKNPFRSRVLADISPGNPPKCEVERRKKLDEYGRAPAKPNPDSGATNGKAGNNGR
jgi:hypothetical protein